jgi:CheY-like chemotaxis protein
MESNQRPGTIQGHRFEHQKVVPSTNWFLATVNLETSSESPAGNKMRKILLVDDNMDVRAVITLGLEQLGFRVVACVDGRDAIERFKVEQPDVAIIDQGLPDIQGIEVGRKLRALAQGRPIVIALLTGSDGPALRQQASERGFDDFLVKPVRIQTLAEWIDRQLEALDHRG